MLASSPMLRGLQTPPHLNQTFPQAVLRSLANRVSLSLRASSPFGADHGFAGLLKYGPALGELIVLIEVSLQKQLRVVWRDLLIGM